MADVAATARERGQVILVGGLALAVTFVVLAVVLNSAIFTENLATRTGDGPGDTPMEFRRDAVAGAGALLDHANRNGGDRSYSNRYVDYRTAMGEWEQLHANYSAVDGLLVAVDAPAGGGTEGTRIADDDAGTDYTSRTGATDWTVGPDVEARGFRLEVARSSLPTLSDSTVESTLSGGGSAAFYIEVEDGGDVWRTAVYRDDDAAGDPLAVMVRDPSGTTATCAASGSSVVIDVAAGRVDGEYCGPLDFLGGLSGAYDVSYANADLIEGTYELTVDRVEEQFRHEVDRENGVVCPAGDATYYDDPAAGTPYTTEAVYSATVDLTYDSSGVTYETDGRVAPDEPGDGIVEPAVTLFEVTDASGSDATLTVDWSVSDPNGDPLTVSVTVTNEDTGAAETYNGGSGSETYTETGAGGDTFEVEIDATDADGNARTVSVDHVADGDDAGCPP